MNELKTSIIRVLIVDDHDLVRHGFTSLLSAQASIKVVASLKSGEDAIDWCRDNKGEVDVVLMDINMPGMGGIEATHRLSLRWPDIGIIIVTIHDEGPLPKQLLNAGAKGYITKGNDSQVMLSAINDVYQGKHYIAKEIAQQLALSALPGEKNKFDGLSRREMQVLMMIAEGTKTQKISEILNLSPKTITTYRKRIHEKLDVKSDIEMMHLAIKNGLLDDDMK